MSILKRILDEKLTEIRRLRSAGIPDPPYEPPARRDFIQGLSGRGVSIIAEVKKASPSKGLLCPDFSPEELVRDYEEAGASAISVLTDEKYFQGSLADLTKISPISNIPLLRKDFIRHEVQIYQAIIAGADAILLIVACLDDETLKRLYQEARDFAFLFRGI